MEMEPALAKQVLTVSLPHELCDLKSVTTPSWKVDFVC